MRTLYIILVNPHVSVLIIPRQDKYSKNYAPYLSLANSEICCAITYIDDLEGCGVDALGLFHDPRPDLFVEEVITTERILEHEVDHL